VESGKWKVESGKWKVESGKWKVQPDASGEKRPIDREVLEVTLKNKTPSAAFA